MVFRKCLKKFKVYNFIYCQIFFTVGPDSHILLFCKIPASFCQVISVQPCLSYNSTVTPWFALALDLIRKQKNKTKLKLLSSIIINQHFQAKNKKVKHLRSAFKTLVRIRIHTSARFSYLAILKSIALTARRVVALWC